MTQGQEVVVTGANGLVGIQVVQQLLDAGYYVHAMLRSEPVAGHPTRHERVKCHTIDLAVAEEQNLVDWLTLIRPVAVIHCAAMTNVDGCEQQPALAYSVNERATRYLARACARAHIHMLLVSTDYVFDGTQPAPGDYHEHSTPHPLGHYGRSKWYGEIAVQEECIGKTPWTICRTSVVYGPHIWARADFTQWAQTQLQQGKTLRIVQDQISSPTCSADLAEMLIKLMQWQLCGIYHTAGSTQLDRYTFSIKLARHLGLDEQLIQPVLTASLKQSAARPLNAGLCVDKIKAQLGHQPLSIEEGLARCWRTNACI